MLISFILVNSCTPSEEVIPKSGAVPVGISPEISPAHPEQEASPPKQAQQKSPLISVPSPGYAELIGVSDGVAGWISRDIIIKIVQVENPASPVIVGTVDTPQFAQASYQDDQYLYIGDKEELQFIPIKEPLGEPIGRYRLDAFWPSVLTVDDHKAFVLSGNQLMILDLSEPTKPAKMSQISLTGNAPTDIYIKGGYAYVVESLGGLNIIDIRNPKNPVAIHVLPFESHTVGFKIRGDYGYLGRIVSVQGADTEIGYTTSSVFEVIDLATAKVVGSLNIPTDIRGLDVSGSKAYIIGSYPYRLTPIDISSPTNPKIIAAEESISGSADFQDIVVSDKYAFIADGVSGLRIVDISHPEKPIHVKDVDLQGRAFDIHRSSNILYLGVEQKYLNFADVHDPQQPALAFSESYVSSYPTASIVLKDRKAYVKTDEFSIYDVSQPSQPKKINQKPAPVDSIQVQGNYLYSTIGEIGLLVYDLSNPVLPREVARSPFPKGIPRDLSVDGRWAVGISNNPYSLSLFDIADPQKPIFKDSFTFEKYPDRVFVKDGYTYVTRGFQGVDIFKIKEGSFTLVKSLPDPKRYAHSVTVSDKKAFVVREGVEIYDVTDPQNPVFVRELQSQGETVRAAAENGYLYLADGFAGMTIAKVPE